MPTRSSSQPKFLAALIRSAYLPVEIPPAITTKYFSKFCLDEYKFLKSQQTILLRKSTSYDTFTAPRTVSGRRNFAIVHPLAQLGLSLQITQRRARIKEIISKQGTSLYRTSEDPSMSKAFSGLDFREWERVTARICSEHPYVLRADISRFFYTAYTHSLPWSIIGKEKVKDWFLHDKARLRAHWSNDIDRALQACQSRETFGFPVGPDTSRIIAELLLAGVESDADFAECVKGKSSYRLLDDFLIGFDDENSALRALAALRSALWKFNLQLNDEKTSVVRSRLIYREKWKLEFDSIALSVATAGRQRKDVYRLVDITLHYCAEFSSGAPAIWACRRLSRLRKFPENIEMIVNAVLRFARDFPSCTSHVAAFFVNNHAVCNTPAVRNRIRSWVRGTVRSNIQHGHDFELAWCLLVAGVLRIVINEDDIAPFEVQPSSIVFAILGMLRERQLLSVSLSNWSWRASFKETGIYGQNWLPFYEAVRRKWTTDKGMITAVNKDPILARMLAANVTFLEDRILDASKISISQRVFRKAESKHLNRLVGKVDDEENDETEEQNAYVFLMNTYD